MKYIISVLFICLIAFGFQQKQNQVSYKESKLNVSTRVIRVSLDSLGTGLILYDGINRGPNITTKVSKKEIVKWKLENNSRIKSLDSIVLKKGVNIFEAKPVKNDGDLIGTVGDFPSGTEEEYGIYFTTEDNKSRMHDPVIQVH